MKTRLLLALITLLVLTAFAPAPFPRSKRERETFDEINLKSFQGTWKVISMEVIEQGNVPKRIPWNITHVRVKGDHWSYLVNQAENSNYRMAIDGTRKPASIDWYTDGAQPNRPGMVGLIRRQGDRVRILYYVTTPENRATSFDDPPVNWWLLTLQRQP
jgi:uncharacterized protein (TIGR03067 family)